MTTRDYLLILYGCWFMAGITRAVEGSYIAAGVLMAIGAGCIVGAFALEK